MIRNIVHETARLIYKMSTLGLSKGPHITRYYMYKHLAQYSRYRRRHQRALSISHSERLATLLGFADRQIINMSYPQYNILNLTPLMDRKFDAVVSDQVLEHINGNPQDAIDEMCRILKPGGLSLHTTCLINPIHKNPVDYWRFTPDALAFLFRKHGRIIDAGGWGNIGAWLFIFMGLRFRPTPEARWHPAHWLAMRNNPAWPIVTWVLGEKEK